MVVGVATAHCCPANVTGVSVKMLWEVAKESLEAAGDRAHRAR